MKKFFTILFALPLLLIAESSYAAVGWITETTVGIGVTETCLPNCEGSGSNFTSTYMKVISTGGGSNGAYGSNAFIQQLDVFGNYISSSTNGYILYPGISSIGYITATTISASTYYGIPQVTIPVPTYITSSTGQYATETSNGLQIAGGQKVDSFTAMTATITTMSVSTIEATMMEGLWITTTDGLYVANPENSNTLYSYNAISNYAPGYYAGNYFSEITYYNSQPFTAQYQYSNSATSGWEWDFWNYGTGFLTHGVMQFLAPGGGLSELNFNQANEIHSTATLSIVGSPTQIGGNFNTPVQFIVPITTTTSGLNATFSTNGTAAQNNEVYLLANAQLWNVRNPNAGTTNLLNGWVNIAVTFPDTNYVCYGSVDTGYGSTEALGFTVNSSNSVTAYTKSGDTYVIQYACVRY